MTLTYSAVERICGGCVDYKLLLTADRLEALTLPGAPHTPGGGSCIFRHDCGQAVTVMGVTFEVVQAFE
jgi:hypothetical protein